MLIPFGHKIYKSLGITKVCIFSWMDFNVLHVSAPFKRTGFTFKLKCLNVVFVDICLLFRMLLSIINPMLAFPVWVEVLSGLVVSKFGI